MEIPQTVKNTINLSKPQKELFDKINESIFEQVNFLNQLSNNKNIIPCISINGSIIYTENEIKMLLSKVESTEKAIRIHPGRYSIKNIENLEKICSYISKHANSSDIIILNINSNNLHTSKCKKIIAAFTNHISDTSFKTYLFHHTIKTFTIGHLEDKQLNVTPALKNKFNFQTTRQYRTEGFIGFADFAGLLPYSMHTTTKLTPHPSYIPVSGDFNEYWGFKGIKDNLDSFETHVYPKYINSGHFKNLSFSHTERCPGCKEIINMKNTTISTKSSDWRKISMLHYLTVVSEFFEK